MEKVYTAVRLLNYSGLGEFESLQSLEEDYRRREKRGLSRDYLTQKKHGIEVANSEKFLMVLGGPGAGKSTFLRRIGLEALKGAFGDYEHGCIPVLLELKRFVDPQIDIKSIIAKEFEICGFPKYLEMLDSALKKGNLLILFDGLDEVPTANRHNLINEIQDFVDRYDKNRFIASCRVAAYHSNFYRFTDVAMADFDDSQIKKFIQNWFGSQEDVDYQTAEKCWEILRKSENMGAKELANSPLLLTFLCLVYDRSQNFPEKRASLYRKALRILLEEWAAEKRILRDDIYQGLNVELEELLLSEIAYKGFCEDQLFFSKKNLVRAIKLFLAGNLNAPKSLDGEAVLNAIEIQQGILVERAEDAFSFSHLTLQEYLTAQHIVDENLFSHLAQTWLTDSRWREVFLLVFGLIRKGGDSYLYEMQQQSRKLITSPDIQQLVEWADWITLASKGSGMLFEKRAKALNLVLDLARTATLSPRNPLFNVLNSSNENMDLVTKAITPSSSDLSDYFKKRSSKFSSAQVLLNSGASASAIAFDHRYISYLKQRGIFNAWKDDDLKKKLSLIEMDYLRASGAGKSASISNAIDEWFSSLFIPVRFSSLSVEKFKELDNFIKANELIIQCKEASLKISPQMWSKVESNLLKVSRLV